MINEDRKKLYNALSSEYDLGTYEEFERNIGDSVKRRKLYDAASADYDLGDFESYSQRIGPTHKESLDAFTAEHGSFLDDFEARDTAETNIGRAGMSSGIYVPTEGAITGEERKRYLDLHKQEEALKKAWYTSDEYLAQKDADALQLSQMRDAINAGMRAYAEANPTAEAGAAFIPAGAAVQRTRGAEADKEMAMFGTASRIMEDAIKMHNAPSKYDGANVWQNIGKFGKGAGSTLSDIDFWSMGLTEIVDNLGVRDVLSNVQDKLGNLNDLSEEAIEEILTPAEKAVLQAWAVNTQEQLNRKDDLSRGYQAGKGAAESLGFMAEFALTGGVGKVTTESVEQMAKWLGKKALTKVGGMTDDVAAKVLKDTGEKIAQSTVGKYGVGLAESLAEAAGRTGVMPSTFRNISEKATEIETDENGNNYLVRMNDAFAKGLADSFIENLSEGGRVNALGTLFGDVAGKIPAYKKMVDKFSHTKASELWDAFNSSGVMNTLRAGGWHGLGEEYLEEWYGNALRTLTGVDKEALKDFATVDNQIVTLTSFLPMTIFGGTVSTAQVLSANKDLEKKAAALKSALMERGYDEAQANNMIDMMRGAAPAEVSETLTPIVNSVAYRNTNEAAALMKPVGEFAAAVQRWQSFNTKYNYQEQEQRDGLRAQMEENLGQFWQQDENGRQTVQRGTNENGEVVYMLGKPSAEDAEVGVASEVAAVTSDGRKVFVNPSEYQLEDELEMDDFLGTEIMAEKGNQEQARMIEEKEAKIAAIRETAVPGTAVNIGTAEVPVQVIVIQRNPDGVIVNTPDGQTRQMTYEEFGNYVGVNAVPMTDAQIDEHEADVLTADRAQREAALDQEYYNEDEALEELADAQNEIEHAVNVNTPFPLKADGTVDQTALWNKDPERWAQWNDEQRQDGGANSLAYVSGAIAKEQAKIAELQAAYGAEADFDARDVIEKEIADTQARVERLAAIQQGYLAQPAVADAAQNVQPEPQTEEEKAKAEEQRRQPLRERAKELSKKLGVKVNIAEEISDVKEAMAREEILRAEVSGGKQTVAGWFNPTTGEVTIYLPHAKDTTDVEQTFVHEVVAHKGIRGLLGEEGFNVLCDAVWDMMTEDERAKYMAYPGVNGDKRAAADEYIAHYAETMNLEESKPVWDRIMDLIMRILNSMGVNLEMTKDQLSDIIVASYQKLVKEAEANAESEVATEEAQATPIVSEEQLNAPNSGTAQQITATDGEVLADTDGKGGVRFSIRTWNEGGRDYLAAWLASDSTLTEEEKADILARMDEFYKNALLYSDTYVPFGTWSDAGVRYDNNGNPLMSVIKANGDYAMNLDFSLVCKKRRPLNRLLRTLVNRNAFATYTLRERELAEINWILQEHGFEVACALCFVDSKRYRVTGVADVFAALYNRLVKSLAPEGVQIAHFNYNNNPNVEVVENGLDTISDDQLNWNRFDRLLSAYKKGSVEYKVAQYLREHPEARKLVDATDFIEAEGFESVKENNPDLLKFYNMKKGTGGPKASFGDVQYLNDILKKEKSFDAEKAYAVGGVRLQSFSDFVPHMYFDYMQLFAELAAKKLPLHAYTKEVLFAKIFGLTGAKINMSLVPAVVEGGIAPGLDAEGNYAWADPVTDAEGNVIQQGQSFPYDEAMAIQQAEGYSKNCGVIAVGISDAHIEKMLDDPNIPFIIPYHKSSLNAIVARMTNIDQYKDYTNVQNTRKASGSKLDKGTKDFNFNEYLHSLGESGTPQQAAQAYLDWCRENKFIPKFSQFAYHPNYYKLLQDFNTIDLTTGEYAPQGAVTMTFPTEESAFGNVETLIQQGLQEDAELEEKMEQEIDGIADQVLARLEEISKEPKMSEKQQAKKMAELADERMAKIKAKAQGPIDLIEEARKAIAREDAKKPNKGSLSFRMTTEMKEIKEKAQADGTFMMAPNGQPTNLTEEQWAMVRTKNFKKWFGDWESDPANASKVVDENGEPKVVYHGGAWRPLLEEKGKAVFQMREGRMGVGAYFTDNFDKATSYAAVNYAKSNAMPKALVNIRTLLAEGYVTEAFLNIRNEGNIEIDEPGVTYYLATDPSQIKSATDNNGDFNPNNNDIRFRVSNKNQAIFVSNAVKAVEGIKQEKATPEQWLKMIEKNGGLKAGEDKWMGLSDWLKDSDKKTLTKQEVLDFTNENMIVIEEQHYGDINEEKATMDEIANRIVEGRSLEELQEMIDENAESASRYDDEAEDEDFNLDEWLMDRMIEEFGDDFGEFYTIQDGYVDQVEQEWWDRDEDAETLEDENGVRRIHSMRENYTTKGLKNNHEIALTVPTIKKWTGGSTNNIHFEDAGDGRAIAWIRFGETWEQRPSPQISRKVLVIDEIQSKRHQEGREKGYMTKEERAKFDAHLDVLKETQDALLAHIEKLVEKYPNTDYHIEDVFKNIGAFSAEDKAELRRLKDAYDAEYAKGTAMVDRQSKLIPDAPFDKNWHELAMKRMLRYAAENGYGVIAWTTGDQQNQRYGLSKVVDEIYVDEDFASTKREESSFRMILKNGDNNHVGVNKKTGIVTFYNEQPQAIGRPLSELLGKELAEKILAARDYQTFREVDFELSEGMKGFYDRMLPAFMNKYGKKWGVKVEDIELPNLENGLTMHSVPVTEEMKSSVMGGQVMFRVRREDETPMEFTQQAVDEFATRYTDVDPTYVINEITTKKALADALNLYEDQISDEQFTAIKKGFDSDGVSCYMEDWDRILIFAKSNRTEAIENTLFHESIHKLDAKDITGGDVLGQWLWDNAEQIQDLPRFKKNIEDSQTYGEDEYAGEMLAESLSWYMSIGETGILMSQLPQELKQVYKSILNELRYESRTEDARRQQPETSYSRARRAFRGNAKKDGSKRDDAQSRQTSKEQGVNAIGYDTERETRVRSGNARRGVAGNVVRNTSVEQSEARKKRREGELTAEERRIIGEYFPEFNKSEDVRMRVNSQGNALTEGQKEFFANSKAVDKDGNLLVLYHGTPRAGFTEFKSGWFTTSKEDAISYSGDRKGRLFDPNEEYVPETLTAGDYRLGYMTFDSEEDRAAFLERFPYADEVMSEREYEDARMGAEDEEYDALTARRKEFAEVWNAYREYERERFVDTPIADLIANPEAYTEEDLMRAILEYDSNATFDSLDDMSAEERKDALVSALQNANEETEGGILDMVIPTRVPRNGEGLKHNDLGNRTYEVYANVENPYEIDANGKGSEFESGDIYKAVEEALADEQYDGVIVRNWRVGRTQQLGDVVVPKDGDQIKLTSNESPTESSDIQFRVTESGEGDIRFSIRTKPAPEKIGTGYKVFYLKDGNLYPPMVANPNGANTPVLVWLDADAAPQAATSKTGRKKVKAGGKGTQGGAGTLAYRPGWHLGKIPYALQFNRGPKVDNPLGITGKDGKVIKVGTYFPADFVWAEVEYANDVDYQNEAMSYGYNKAGNFQHSLAGLPKVPEDGSYIYRTNANPATDPWIITGAMKVKRLLTPSEVDQMVIDAGREPQKRQEGAVTDAQIEALNKELGLVEEEEEVSFRVTYDNFYKDTTGVWKAIPVSEVPQREPDYTSKKFMSENVSSRYWYGSDENGDYVIRESDHWSSIIKGENTKKDFEANPYSRSYTPISSCRWGLDVIDAQERYGKIKDEYIEDGKAYGKIYLSDLQPRKVSFRVTGTPTDEVVANGLTLSPAQTAEVAANIFAALPEESREKIADGLNGNILGLQDAIMQIPASLATKENWNEEDRAMADVVAEEMTKMAGEMTRPFSAPEALWLLYNNLNKGNDLISQASRALVQRNLGFDEETLERQEQAKEGVRFRTVGDATSNAQASLYNRGAVNAMTRLKESYVDMNASVEELVKAIEKKTGKQAQGFENILLALNQQSSKGLAAMESYTQKFLNPMFDEIRRIMDATNFKYEDIVRYVILKHGLERNKKLAQRDAKAHYQEIYDDIISKISGMTAAQKRTYLTNAQLKEADAKAELATLKAVDMSAMTDEEKREHKKKLAVARKAVEEVEEHLRRAQKIASMSEQEAKDELDNIFKRVENGTDSVYKEMRENDYSGISSMFYDQLGVDRKNFSTEEQYQAALMEAKKDKYSSLADVEAAAEAEVRVFEGLVDTKELWKRINACTKETLRQQYEANMISKDQYENLRNMFEYYVPLRGFKDNTAEDMYTYYRKPNSTGYTKPILGAEGRKTEAESPFGWIASMAGSAIASNVKNEAKLALYYFVSNRPNNGIATISRTWFVDSGEVDERGKKIFKPAYPPFSEDLSSDEAKARYESWQENMRELQKKGQAYEAGQRLNLGNAVVNISDANKPEHIVNVKVGGKDYTIIINGNPRAAQAINGDLNIEGTSQDYSALFGPVLRWMSSVNTSYNPEFWITNMMRDMAFTMMAVNIKEDPAYRRKFSKNYLKAFKVVSLVAKNENGTIGDSYLEQQYKDFVKYGGVTGYTQIKDSETWEKEIENYLSSNDPESIKSGKVMRGMKTAFHAAHRFGESLEQVSRFAAFLTARETGKSINEAINDAKEITVNFNRKGSGKMITLEEAKYLTDKNGQRLSKPEQWMVVGLSSIAPLGRRFIMFFNAAIQGLNATYKLMKKNPKRFTGWALGYAAVGMLNALLHAMMDDDEDYLDIPQYERRNSLMIGGNGAYFKWALPQESRAFYALGDLVVETIMGRNPHQNVVGEALKIGTEILPVNPSEGWKAFMPSIAIPLIELALNEDYKGSPIYNDQKWLSEEEKERTAKWSKAYQGTGWMYVKIAQGLNFVTGGDEHDAGLINLQPEKMEHLVQSAFGGTIRTADKFINTISAVIDPDEPWTVRQTPFLNRFLTINDERFKNVHVNDVFDYYKADAEHALTLEKQYIKDRDMDSLTKLRSSDEYQWAKIYGKYKKPLKAIQEKIKVADGTAEKKELMKQQDELKKKMIKEISEL